MSSLHSGLLHGGLSALLKHHDVPLSNKIRYEDVDVCGCMYVCQLMCIGIWVCSFLVRLEGVMKLT